MNTAMQMADVFVAAVANVVRFPVELRAAASADQ